MICAVLWVGLASSAALSEGVIDGADYAFVQKQGSALPGGLQLRDASGRTQELDAVFGRAPVILALGYFHCPSLCGVVRNDLFEALAKSGLRGPADYELVAISIDPAETPADAAAALADDRDRYPMPGSDRAWHFLTGDAAAVAAVEEAVGFRSRYDVHLRQFLHPAGIVVLTPDRRVSGYVLGVGYSAGDIATAVTLAQSGALAAAASPILLLCFDHDATTGRYSLAIMKVLRLGGLLTLLIIAGMVLLIWRKDRRGGSCP